MGGNTKRLLQWVFCLSWLVGWFVCGFFLFGFVGLGFLLGGGFVAVVLFCFVFPQLFGLVFILGCFCNIKTLLLFLCVIKT